MPGIDLNDEEKNALLNMVLSFVQDLDQSLEVSKPDSYVFIMMGYSVRMKFENVMTVSIGEDVAHMTAFTGEQKRIMRQIFEALERIYLVQDKKRNRKQYFLKGLGL